MVVNRARIAPRREGSDVTGHRRQLGERPAAGFGCHRAGVDYPRRLIRPQRHFERAQGVPQTAADRLDERFLPGPAAEKRPLAFRKRNRAKRFDLARGEEPGCDTLRLRHRADRLDVDAHLTPKTDGDHHRVLRVREVERWGVRVAGQCRLAVPVRGKTHLGRCGAQMTGQQPSQQQVRSNEALPIAREHESCRALLLVG